MLEAITTKNGEICIETSLRRSAQGLLVNVKAHPRVEEFMARLSNGDQQAVTTVGRHWLTEYTEADSKVKHVIRERPLTAYVLYNPLDQIRMNDGIWVNTDRLGHPLLELSDRNNGMPEETLNLSFLRLVGISDPEGVSFLIRSVHSMSGLRKLRDLVQNAQNIFYTDYIKTIEYTVTTATQTF